MSFKVRLKYDLDEFQSKCNELMQNIRKETVDILKKSTVVFVNAAAKATPPKRNGSFSMTIEKEKYQRPFVSLLKLIRGECGGLTANEIDRSQFAKGMKFKIFNTRNTSNLSKAPAYAYCRSKGELKQLCRIKHRGLAKVMWAKSLTNIGVNIPIGIQRLINKSPALNDLTYSKTTLENEEDKATVKILNQATNIDKMGDNAKRQGYYKVAKELKHRLAALAKKRETL